MEDIDRRMTISEGLLHDVAQQNWQGAPLHVSGAITTYTAERLCSIINVEPSRLYTCISCVGPYICTHLAHHKYSC